MSLISSLIQAASAKVWSKIRIRISGSVLKQLHKRLH